MIIMPSAIYAQNDENTLQSEQEQYILERTGNILVKIFGSIELDGRDTSRTEVELTHTTPDENSQSHLVRTNNQGYYEFYFIHNWNSVRGIYDIIVSKDNRIVGEMKYELIEDPSYKSDKQVKEEYWMKEENKIQLIDSVISAWKYYEGNKKEENYWMKNLFHWYYTNSITEEEVINSIQYYVTSEILKLD